MSKIKTILFDTIKEKGVSIAQFAREAGISEDKVYQWQDRKNRTGSNPKGDDVIKIQEWLRKFQPPGNDGSEEKDNYDRFFSGMPKFSLNLEARVLALETELTVLRAKWEIMVSYLKDQLPVKEFEALEKASAAVETALKKSVS